MLDDFGQKEVFVADNKVHIVFHEPIEEIGLSLEELKKLIVLLEKE